MNALEMEKPAEQIAWEKPAREYLAKIRNTKKRLYGFAYFGFLTGHRSEPALPRDISAMASQAVRMSLRQILGV